MYLTKIDMNPRNRQARRDMADVYQLHRTILSGFPADGKPDRILFRREENTVFVQSPVKPQYTNDHFSYSVKTFDPILTKGQVLRFRLRANPTVKRQGKRLGILNEEDQKKWLKRKLKGAVIEGVRTIPEGFTRGKMTFFSVLFEGYLRVDDPGELKGVLHSGIGSAKGFGFGLLSIAP